MADETSFARLMETAGAQGAALRLRAGEQVNATVIQTSEDFVFVDVGTPSDGRIARSELLDANGQLRVKVGDRLQVTVVDPRPDGPLVAVAFGHGDRMDTATLELAQKSGTPVEAEVARVVKGGLEVMVGQARAFCPASQVELSYIADLTPYVGQRFEFKVLEIRDGGRSIVLSRRALLEDRRKEAALTARSRLIVGTDVEGTVQSLGQHGAVVDLDGVEGFIHLSELANHRVERAEDAVKVGERVTTRILSVEESPKGLRVRLSLRALQAQGSNAGTAPPAVAPDEVLPAQVTKVLQRGVVVQTARGEGLIPLRELGLAPGADHRRAYPPGKQLDVVIVSQAGGRLTFSATQVARVEERKNYREFSTGGAAAPSGGGLGSLGDVLRQKLKAPSPEGAEPPSPAKPSSDSSRADVTKRRR